MGLSSLEPAQSTKALWVGLHVYDPDAASVLKGYKAKYRKLPTLGDDVLLYLILPKSSEPPLRWHRSRAADTTPGRVGDARKG